MMPRIKHGQHGFTLVELLVATAIFSLMLTISTVVIIGINRVYFKGVSATSAQIATRNTVEDLARHLRSQSGAPAVNNYTSDPTQHYFCIGEDVYYYRTGAVESSAAPHIFAQWHQADYCTSPPALEDFSGTVPTSDDPLAGSKNAKELISGSVSIHDFFISATEVRLTTAYGPLDTLDTATIGTPNVHCKDGIDSKFCGVSTLKVNVTSRTQAL